MLNASIWPDALPKLAGFPSSETYAWHVVAIDATVTGLEKRAQWLA